VSFAVAQNDRSTFTVPTASPNQSTRRVMHALLLLQQSTAPDPIESVAGALNLSSSRLRHLVKHETGMSPTQYLRTARLEKARRLLTGSSLLVKQILWEAGFTDISHFLRDFKKHFGETPSVMRERVFAELLAQRIAGIGNS
jgi:transcriptional regulator GlxA family with amidase domain